MEWVSGLSDARICAVEQMEQSLTFFLDSSYIQLHPANSIRQITFLDYQIVKNAPLVGLFWYQDRLKHTGTRYELHLKLCDSGNHKKEFVIRFSRFELIRSPQPH